MHKNNITADDWVPSMFGMRQATGSDCIHGCRDPLWGGEGTCATPSSGHPVCLCDDGFASRDAMGHASCVPRRVLVAGYAVMAAASFLTTAVLLWQANKYRYLPAGVRASQRRALTRLRALVFGSVYTVGFGFIAVVLAILQGEACLNDDVFLQIDYGLLMPSIVLAVITLAEFWVEGLPSQLIPLGSLAEKLKNASEKHHAFKIFGGLNAGVIAVLGALTLFFPVWPKLGADVATLAGGLIACLAVLFVAISMTLVINRSTEKTSEASRAFYLQAKENIWLQALGLCILVGAEAVLGIVPRMITAGRGVSVILWCIQILLVQAGALMVAMFTNFPHHPRRTPVLKLTNTNASTTGVWNYQQPRMTFKVSAAGAAKWAADMPLKHLARVRIRRDETESDEYPSEPTGNSQGSSRRSSSRRYRHLCVDDVLPEPGRRKSSGQLAPLRHSHSVDDASAERGGGGVLQREMASVSKNTLAEIGEEEKSNNNVHHADAKSISSNLAQLRRELKAPSQWGQPGPPLVADRKLFGQTRGLVSTAGNRWSAHGRVGGGVIDVVRVEQTSSVPVSDQQRQEQQHVSHPVETVTPRESNRRTEPSWMRSMLKPIGGGGGVPVIGKVAPIEPV